LVRKVVPLDAHGGTMLVLLLASTRGGVQASRERKAQILSAWLLLAGAGLGVLPLVMLRKLLVVAEILLALAPPLLTFAICARILAEPVAGTPPEGEGSKERL
jgi:hypothetical protein